MRVRLNRDTEVFLSTQLAHNGDGARTRETVR